LLSKYNLYRYTEASDQIAAGYAPGPGANAADAKNAGSAAAAMQAQADAVRSAELQVGLDTTLQHVIVVRQNTVQLMTASTVHVTNLTPGSDSQYGPCN
jgi:hypothetical protein